MVKKKKTLETAEPIILQVDQLISEELSAQQQQIEVAAYYRSLNRNFAPGGELEDWLEAEQEVVAL